MAVLAVCLPVPAHYIFTAAEVVIFDSYIVCFKTLGDLTFYVTGSEDENELVVYQVLTALYESINIVLRCATAACCACAANELLSAVGFEGRNELVVYHALTALYESINIVLRCVLLPFCLSRLYTVCCGLSRRH